MKILWIPFNEIINIKPITSLTNLSNINMSNNNISIIPNEINNLIHLKLLDISHNNIKTFDSIKLNKLEILLLNNNILNNINGLKDCIKLRRLKLNNNFLTSIPSTISKLELLSEFNISKNPITNHPIYLKKILSIPKLIGLNKNKFMNNYNKIYIIIMSILPLNNSTDLHKFFNHNYFTNNIVKTIFKLL
jgi:Leucine-rich repeat (LRR) protein